MSDVVDVSRYVFLDRDGTLVQDAGYTHRVDDYVRLPGVVVGLSRLAAAGFRFAIVTNQSGIGRGYYDESAFHAFQRHLVADLGACDIRIDATYFCPHRPDQGCPCRKPEPGLILQACRELDAAPAASWLIGDAPSDVEAARRAGRGGAVRVGALGDVHDPSDRVVDDLEAAADWILARQGAP